jgi:uncharacterized protein YqhQ
MAWRILELIKFLALSLVLIALAVSLLVGSCLIIGILHGINVFVLPFIRGILALWGRLIVGTETINLRTGLPDPSRSEG